MARKIGILIIEDSVDLTCNLDSEYIEIYSCSGISKGNELGAAQNLDTTLDRVQRSGSLLDIIIFDVNMFRDVEHILSDDPEVRNDEWAIFDLRRYYGAHGNNEVDLESDPIAPYGPMLTLPFLAHTSPHLILQPISAFWEESEIVNNGLFLVSLSMLLSKRVQTDEVLDPLGLRQYIRDRRTKEIGLGVPGYSDDFNYNAAINKLSSVLSSELFDRFEVDNLAGILDVADFIEEDLKSGAMASEVLSSLQLINVHFVDTSRNTVDSILLTSLFSHHIDEFGILEGAKEIIDQIRRLAERKSYWDLRPFMNVAKEVIAGIPSSDNWDDRNVLKKLRDIDPTPENEVGYEITRYYINLFSWVKAWFLRADYHRDNVPVKNYFYAVIGQKSSNAKVLQYLMYCSKERRKAKKKLSHPEHLRHFWQESESTEISVENYKLDSEEPKGLVIPESDLEAAAVYYQELLVLYETDLDIEHQQGGLPTWLRPCRLNVCGDKEE